MQSGEYIKIYSYMICKEIQQVIADFGDSDCPGGQQLKYNKKEYPLYDDNWVKQQLHSFLTESAEKTIKQKAALLKLLNKERAQKAAYLEYQIAIHKELKRLVLKHCSHITTISGNGLRQIDYIFRGVYVQNHQKHTTAH